MRLVDCGDDVWLGDFQACDAHLTEFDLAIHIWRPTNEREGRLCQVTRDSRTGKNTSQLVLLYREGEPLSKASISIDEIAAYARRPGKLLAHCAAGAYRGPTLAILAKVARGCDPFTATADVARALHTVGEGNLFGNHGVKAIYDFAVKQKETKIVTDQKGKKMSDKTISISWDHGMGDTGNFCRLMALYQRRGYSFEVECHPNKAFLFAAAGAKILAPGQAKKHNGWPYPHPDYCWDYGKDWVGNKNGYNTSLPPLPDIGTRDDLWREMCQTNLTEIFQKAVSPKAWDKVDRAIETLPRPLVLVHSTGNSCQAVKSIPGNHHYDLYKGLLDRMPGTVILLDWDSRVDPMKNYRVRHLNQLGGLDTEEFVALLLRSQLLIGVDSGPLHTAGVTDILALGIMKGEYLHYPATASIPRRRTLNMVEGKREWNKWKRLSYQIVEKDHSPENIAELAAQLLEPCRYLPNDPDNRAADLVLHQFVREFCRGVHRSDICDYADRNITFDIVLRELRAVPDPTIIETGTIRGEEDWAGAGFATYLFAAYLEWRGAGYLHSVDLGETNCRFAAKWTGFTDRAIIHHARGADFLRDWNRPIDLLYLDSCDTYDPNHAEVCLEELQAAWPKLKPSALILIDDTPWAGDAWIGKGARAVPWALANGATLLMAGYQVLLRK